MNKDNWNDLQEYLPLFSELDLDMAFLYITETGYEKGIIDATVPVRSFLNRNNLHNYETQGKGQAENGVTLSSKMILHDKTIDLVSSLYRPKTKKGDPRIWFRGIKKYCDANSFIVLATNKNILYILNLTDNAIKQSLSSKGYVYQELLRLSQEKQTIAHELYNKIKTIHNKGFIPTVVSGDTGVGMTLEHELGIPPNSSRKPDYKGIELKTFRNNEGSIPSRKNLFSQVPNWKNSKLKSTKEILNKFGYWDDVKKRIALKITIKANNFNRQGFLLKINENENKLYVFHRTEGKILEWNIDDLKKALLKKHHETFWIEAETKMINGIEHFNYKKVTHTKNPQINLLEYLIDSRMISLDFTMHIKENGSARDHGYLFKIDERNIDKLFPKSIEYDLSNLQP